MIILLLDQDLDESDPLDLKYESTTLILACLLKMLLGLFTSCLFYNVYIEEYVISEDINGIFQ